MVELLAQQDQIAATEDSAPKENACVGMATSTQTVALSINPVRPATEAEATAADL